jgi:hypothetical protein
VSDASRRHPLEESLIAMMIGWVDTCLNGHDICLRNDQSSYIPARLIGAGPIDGSGEIRLIETYGMLPTPGIICDEVQIPTRSKAHHETYPLRYATLSHCWGKTPHLTTTTATPHQRKQNIHIHRLSNKSAVFKPIDQPEAFISANQLRSRNK